MEQFLSSVSQVVTASLTWITQYTAVIMNNPALTTICIAVPIVSVSVDMLKRLIRL